MISIKQKGYFGIDVNNVYYEGYSDPSFRWNGWACPYFEKNVADYIAIRVSVDDNYSLYYDKEKDMYVLLEYENGELVETDYFEKRIINTPEGIKEVYPIGAGNWIWDDYTLEQVKEFEDSIIITNDELEKIKEESIEMDY